MKRSIFYRVKNFIACYSYINKNPDYICICVHCAAGRCKKFLFHKHKRKENAGFKL